MSGSCDQFKPDTYFARVPLSTRRFLAKSVSQFERDIFEVICHLRYADGKHPEYPDGWGGSGSLLARCYADWFCRAEPSLKRVNAAVERLVALKLLTAKRTGPRLGQHAGLSLRWTPASMDTDGTHSMGTSGTHSDLPMDTTGTHSGAGNGYHRYPSMGTTGTPSGDRRSDPGEGERAGARDVFKKRRMGPGAIPVRNGKPVPRAEWPADGLAEAIATAGMRFSPRQVELLVAEAGQGGPGGAEIVKRQLGWLPRRDASWWTSEKGPGLEAFFRKLCREDAPEPAEKPKPKSTRPELVPVQAEPEVPKTTLTEYLAAHPEHADKARALVGMLDVLEGEALEAAKRRAKGLPS